MALCGSSRHVTERFVERDLGGRFIRVSGESDWERQRADQKKKTSLSLIPREYGSAEFLEEARR